MAGYSKLFSSIVTSSIWSEDDKTLRVWFAMLAMTNANGYVEGSIPGFAHVARVTIPEMEHAIARLSSPDPYSRTPDNEGRRIEVVPGGWLILNYPTYRARGQAKEGGHAVVQKRYRDKKRNAA